MPTSPRQERDFLRVGGGEEKVGENRFLFPGVCERRLGANQGHEKREKNFIEP